MKALKIVSYAWLIVVVAVGSDRIGTIAGHALAKRLKG